MTTADNQQRPAAYSEKILGRVLEVLFSTPGPLSRCLGFRTWPDPLSNGYVLAWHGITPTEEEVADYLAQAAADDTLSLALRPGDVRGVRPGPGGYTMEVDVSGVVFQLRAEPTPSPETFAAMGDYWRTETLTRTMPSR
ncbi:hypothetical protein ACQP1O_20475 [Nocardia sp. CA-151230]|uniref:hypothetical protein n=1 Tax=Nocardia sp. CA-151230 TaxID=3239982 RepID=UPI003D921837